MTKMLGLASARRSISIRRCSGPSFRNAGSHEISGGNPKTSEGGQDDDLVATIIRAIDLARSGESSTTVYLLKMALLNEGIRLADDLSRAQESLLDRRESVFPPPFNFVGAEQLTNGQSSNLASPSASPAGARPRQSPVLDRERPQAGEKYSSVEDPAPLARPGVKPSSNAALSFLASLPPRD